MQHNRTRRWPDKPYKGLGFYSEADAPLFAGREDDISRCASALADWKTRALLLHGDTGCGKSSFLLAGLTPYIEKKATGVLFRTDWHRPVQHFVCTVHSQTACEDCRSSVPICDERVEAYSPRR